MTQCDTQIFLSHDKTVGICFSPREILSELKTEPAVNIYVLTKFVSTAWLTSNFIIYNHSLYDNERYGYANYVSVQITIHVATTDKPLSHKKIINW